MPFYKTFLHFPESCLTKHWYSLTNGIRTSIYNMKFANFSLIESGKQSRFDGFEAQSFISLTKTDVSSKILCSRSLCLVFMCLASPYFVLHCFVHSLQNKNVDSPHSSEIWNKHFKKKYLLSGKIIS